MKTETILSAVLISAAALTVLMFAAPFSAPYGAYAGLGGSIGITDRRWSIFFPDVLYAFGDMVCHQQEGRSLILNGSQMPLCARCTFAIIGAVLGALTVLLHKGLSAKRAMIAGSILIATAAADWAVQAFLGTAFILSLAVTGAAGGTGLSVLLYGYLEYGSGEK